VSSSSSSSDKSCPKDVTGVIQRKKRRHHGRNPIMERKGFRMDFEELLVSIK